MKRLFAGATCLAGALTLSMVALAQSTQPQTQSPAQGPTPPAAQDVKAPEQQVTIVGCVQKEDDYRRARNLGKGGAVGTGVGSSNEFVLINASIAPPAAAPAGTTGTPEPAGTDAFELTGRNESQAQTFVGKRVEITGKLKAAETAAAGTTGGTTEAVPGSRDLKLRELEVMSVKETTGTCPAMR